PVAPRGTLSPDGAAFARTESTDSYSSGAVTLSTEYDDTVGCGDTTTVMVKVTGSTQPQSVDLALVLDASGSVSSAGWNQMQQFGVDLVHSLSWSPTTNRMGIVEFSTQAQVKYRFAYPQSATALTNFIANLPWTQGYTNTRAAVDSVLHLYQTEGRPDAARMMIMVTDGVPLLPVSLGDPDPCPDATALSLEGIHTVIVGVGPQWNPQPLSCLVTSPDDEMFVANFSSLSSLLTPILQQVPRVNNAVYTAVVPAGFTLVGTPTGTAGSVAVVGDTITWTVGDVGGETDSLAISVARAAQGGGQEAMLSDQSLDYTIGTTSHSEAVADLMTEALACDTTPPVITPDITGDLGDNGWYTSDVTLAWNVTDPESAVTDQTGCDTAVVDTDTPGDDFACSATSAGGTDTVAVTIMRDATPPTVAYAGNVGTYHIIDPVDITCSASDATSGLASSTCADLTGTGLDFGPGDHTFTATATDNAGNTASASTTFTVIVTADDLEALVNQWVTKPGVANALIAKLETAKNAHNENALDGALQAFINQLEAQSGKSISADHADTLITLAESLM
ncbi:MAG TPA: VWA domain-containing protein, partial [Longimicrobiales bacterium]|nr:VWA domain-containing protein [Longimicrobiales bacterium]